MVANGIDRLPACYGVGAYHGVSGSETIANIFWGAAWSGVQLEVLFLGSNVELGLRVGGRQGFEELLVRSGEAVVEFVAGSPKRVYEELQMLLP
jgi:hypothetical protein